MDRILKVLACIYGILGTIGSILISLALGQTPVSTATGVIYKTDWLMLILAFLILELSVVVVCAVLMAFVKIIDSTDELLFYAHKRENPDAYTATASTTNTTSGSTTNN